MSKDKMKYFGKGLAIVVVMIFLFATVLYNSIFGENEFGQRDITNLESGQTLDGSGFFAGSIIEVDGTVEGTTFISGQDVSVNGIINGDLFVVAQNVEISGNVTGNIYCTGQSLTFGGHNKGDVFVAGQNIKVDKEALFERDLFSAAGDITMNGTIQRDFNGAGSIISIDGLIGRDVGLEANKIEIQDEALIGGDLNYKSEMQAYFAPGSKISGRTDWSVIKKETRTRTSTVTGTVTNKLLGMASALLIWFVIRIWKPNFWKRTANSISEQPIKTLGVGAIALIIVPVLIILAMITIIGLPLGILLGIAYGISIYLSKIVAAVFIGAWLEKRFGWFEIHKGFWMVLLGLIIITVLGMIPILGFLLWLIILFAGLGTIIVSNYRTKKSTLEKI